MGHSACLIAVSTTPYRLHDHAVGRPPAGPFPRVVVMGCGDAEQALDTVAAPHQAMEVVAMRRWWRRPAKLVERTGLGPIPDCDTVVPEGQRPLRELLTSGWNEQPTEPLPVVRAPLLTRGARWRTRNNRHAGRPDWYQW